MTQVFFFQTFFNQSLICRFEDLYNLQDDNMEFAQALQQGIATLHEFEANQIFVEDIEIYTEAVEFEGK